MGCGNHGCILEEPKGLATNGRCRCLDELPTMKRIAVTHCILELRELLLEANEELEELGEILKKEKGI